MKRIRMENDTDRINRVLLLWLDLLNAMSRARALDPVRWRSAVAPWDSPDAGVRDAWNKLTDPNNLLALEQWLCQSAEGQQAEWARKALQICRERDKAERRHSP